MNYEISTTWTVIIIIGAFWEIVWKGFALWRASQRDQPVWFGVMLIVNTLGLLPIFYLLTHREEK